MTVDIALSRLDHDLYAKQVVVSAGQAGSKWDDSESEWDNDASSWDTKADVFKYEIWLIDGADKVAQQIKINLLSFLGEWFLDTTYGVPYLEEILVKNPRMSSVEVIIRDHINSVPHVTHIDSFAMSWNRQARTLHIEYSASTDLGPIQDSIKLNMTMPRE